MKDIIFYVVVPIVAALAGGLSVPFVNMLKHRRDATYDDKQSLIGKYSCDWYIESAGSEKLYTADVVEIEKIAGSRLRARGKDKRFSYRLEGNVSRGGVVAFYYIIINKPMSLTGSLTMTVNAAGSELKGRWCGYITEEELACGRVVWKRFPDFDSASVA